jgi:hypothetical protein
MAGVEAVAAAMVMRVVGVVVVSVTMSVVVWMHGSAWLAARF